MSTRGMPAVVVLVLLGMVSCAPAKKVPAAAPAPATDWASKLQEADSLYAEASYLALGRALLVLQNVLAVPEWRGAATERYVRTVLALGLRECELGMSVKRTPGRLSSLAADEPAVGSYGPCVELLGYLPSKLKGIAGDNLPAGRTLDEYFDWINAHVPALDQDLKIRAESDDLVACFRAALRETFSFKFADKLNAGYCSALHPESRLAEFQDAVSPRPDRDRLNALLDRNPEFIEVHYYLGNLALEDGRLVTAEQHYLKVYDRIPESPSVLISLANIAFQMEELEPCLEYNEKALALVPAYRDALLGKGMCLGYLGKHHEALETLRRMLELGTYYQGEAHYWTAWNLNELERLDEARKSIDAAKMFLFGQSDVTTLSGLIAYKQGRLDDAERDLRASLKSDPSDADAAYYLGKLYADRKDWRNSGVYFMGAAESFWKKELGLEKKIGEIEESTLTPERKERLLIKKKRQMIAVQASKATCQYNGAAGFFNAGSPQLALGLAELSAGHPAFSERAAALVRLIKSKIRGAER
ncbi:MAG: tetratricopeptide repeat protein [Candidatus Aminicenantales bacterium]